MVVARKIFGVFDDSKWHPKPLYSLLFKKPMKPMVLNMGEIFTGNYSLYIGYVCLCLERGRSKFLSHAPNGLTDFVLMICFMNLTT